MTIEEMHLIISQEKLDKYNRFYFGRRYIGENCLSMKAIDDDQYEICITGERGNHHICVLSESEACDEVIKYLRFGKQMHIQFGSRW